MANEKRLIDANKLAVHKFPLTPLRYHVGWNDAIAAVIENAPTVDAVEVVRCKDCKYGYFNKAHNAYLCKNPNGLTSHLKVDYFCSYGERRTEDDHHRTE